MEIPFSSTLMGKFSNGFLNSELAIEVLESNSRTS